MIVHNSHYEKFADGTVRCIDDEIPFEIPSSWQWCRIGDIFNHASGKQQSSLANKVGKPRQFITTSNLYWGYFDLSIVKTMNFTDEEIKNCSATKGDLLVCEGGVGYGRSAIWNEEYDICLQNHVHRLRPFIAGICDYIFFLLYYLKESDQLSSVGTAMPGLSANRLKGILVPLPPLSEQYSIVSQLQSIWPLIKKYDDQYVKLNKLNISVKSHLKKSILQEAIQGKLVLQNWEDEPVSTLLQRIKAEKERLIKEKKIKRDKQESIIFRGDDNCYFEKLSDGTVQKLEVPFDIPERWEWVRLGDLVYNLSGLSYKKEDLEVKHDFPIRVLRGGNIVDGTWLIKDDDVKISPQFVKSDLLLKAGTFITPAVSSFEQVGKTGLIETDLADTVVGGFVLMLVPFYKEAPLLRYLLYLFQTPFYKSLCQSMVNKSGQAFYNLSRTKLMNAAIPLPPLEEQQRIDKYLDAIFTHIR